VTIEKKRPTRANEGGAQPIEKERKYKIHRRRRKKRDISFWLICFCGLSLALQSHSTTFPGIAYNIYK
jgi:hypothetical protein